MSKFLKGALLGAGILAFIGATVAAAPDQALDLPCCKPMGLNVFRKEKFRTDLGSTGPEPVAAVAQDRTRDVLAASRREVT